MHFLLSAFPSGHHRLGLFFGVFVFYPLDLQASKDELQKPDVVKKIGDLIEAVEHFSKYGELPAESKHSSKRESFLAKYITGLSRKPDGIHNQDYVHLTKSIEAIMWTPILEMTKPDINNAAAIGLSPIPRVQAHDLLYALDGLLWLGSADNNITEEALEVTKLYLRLLEWGTNGADFTSDTDAASELEEAQGVNEATMEASPLADSPCPDDVYGAPGPNEATMDLGTFDALSCAKLEGGLYASAVTETAMGLDSDAQAVTETSVEKLDPSDVLLGLEGGTGAPGISEAAMYLGTSFDTFLLQLEEEGFDAAIDLDTCNASVLADGDNSWADHPSFEQAWEALEEKY